MAAHKWPARDWILLPLVAVITFLVLAIPAEWLFRKAYPQILEDSCVRLVPGQSYVRARPNCVAKLKTAEGVWTENRYNACGYRTPEGCGPKPAGAIRFAVVGSSTGAGYVTPYSETMAARTAAALKQACHKPVEFQNLGLAGEKSVRLVARTREALALGPDALLVVISPFDFEAAPEAAGAQAGAAVGNRQILRRIKMNVQQSRLLYMGSYAVLRDDASYLPVYLGSGENPAFMRSPLNARWQGKLRDFEASIASVGQLAQAAHAPAWLVFVPQRAQAALIASNQALPDGIVPHQLPDLLNGIATRHGLGFVDSTREIPKRIASAKLFYAVNGHINGQGHAMVSRAILRSLAGPERPDFLQGCTIDQKSL